MRKIWFRGKRLDNAWVEGYFFAKPILEKYFIILGEEQWMVKPNTIGQYTGLDDMNGNKIFEGDIVRGAGGLPWLIAFENNAFVCKDKYMEIYFTLFEQHDYDYKENKWMAPSERFEVIGNIYDNPELLNY